MGNRISRRDFLKLAGLGSAASAALVGCDSTIPVLQQKLFGDARDYFNDRESACLATICSKCPVGCGLIVHVSGGAVRCLEGNPAHPANRGELCALAQAAMESNNSPGRIPGPLHQSRRGSGNFTPIGWKTATRVLTDIFRKYAPGEIGFLLGFFPDHLHDLVQIISKAAGGFHILRFDAFSQLDNPVTLMDAVQKLFGARKIPYFDLERADVVFTFGASFQETWLSHAARRKSPKPYRRLVQFGPYMPAVGEMEVEWIPILPGSEAIVAQALTRLVFERMAENALPGFSRFDLDRTVEVGGIPMGKLAHLADLFVRASRKAAIPGSFALGAINGLAAAESILALNVAAGNLGKEGGVFLVPDSPIHPGLNGQPSTIAEIAALIERMRQGQVKALLVHGVDPVYDLPMSLEFKEAMRNVETVISFASLLNDTARQADYLFPDRTPLESWGYQRSMPGVDRMTVSGVQPATPPQVDSRSTADLLLAVVRDLGNDLAIAVPYDDEVDFIRKSLSPLVKREGAYTPASPASFWTHWMKNGGWWEVRPTRLPPVVCRSFDHPYSFLETKPVTEEDLFYLIPLFHSGHRLGRQTHRPVSDDGKSIARVEMYPAAARRLGLCDHDVVRVSSSMGEIQGEVCENPSIYPTAVAVSRDLKSAAAAPTDQECSPNLLDLLDNKQNESGEMAFAANEVKVSSI